MILERHGLDAVNSTVDLSRFNRAIQNGVEDGTFALPKGPSGKVKLAPKPRPATNNEVRFFLQLGRVPILIKCTECRSRPCEEGITH